MDIATEIEDWIDRISKTYSENSISCASLYGHLSSSYPLNFLEKCRYVVVKRIPRPEINLPEFYDFLEMDLEGVTYKNIYFLKSGYENNIALHLHELVHVAQWEHLGAKSFINRYLTELKVYGYDEAPLEKMAYYAQSRFEINKTINNIPKWVSSRFSKI
jgi:hypothetical protein